ncbi:MAG TPA: RluA family pseudouridine synthase [Bacilli bacterium]|nr:RluA family pseudouridine synthase [Bacilli bacterium]
MRRSRKTGDIRRFIVQNNGLLLETLLVEVQGYSRNNIKSFLTRRQVLVNDVPVRQFDYKLLKGDEIRITRESNRLSDRPRLPIIYEDDLIIVVNKPSGLLTIASEKERKQTAYRYITEYVRFKNKHARIFIVHRLDQDTSGVLMFAKTKAAQQALQKEWNKIVTKRGYHAVVEGILSEKSGIVRSYLYKSKTNEMYSGHRTKHGKYAETHYKVVKEGRNNSLVDVNIKTGRKNQIRVHLKDLGHPIVGDDKYGNKSQAKRLFLHAYELKLISPFTNKEVMFTVKTPQNFFDI